MEKKLSRCTVHTYVVLTLYALHQRVFLTLMNLQLSKRKVHTYAVWIHQALHHQPAVQLSNPGKQHKYLKHITTSIFFILRLGNGVPDLRIAGGRHRPKNLRNPKKKKKEEKISIIHTLIHTFAHTLLRCHRISNICDTRESISNVIRKQKKRHIIELRLWAMEATLDD